MKFLSILLLTASPLFGEAPAIDGTQNGEGYVYFGGICGKDDGCYAQLLGGVGNFYIVRESEFGDPVDVNASHFRGVYVGGEFGYFYQPSEPGAGLGRGFINLGYSQINRENPGWVVPFAELGVGGYFRSGGVWMGKVGGGATFWFHRRFGIRGAACWERPLQSRYSGYNGVVITLGLSIR